MDTSKENNSPLLANILEGKLQIRTDPLNSSGNDLIMDQDITLKLSRLMPIPEECADNPQFNILRMGTCHDTIIGLHKSENSASAYTPPSHCRVTSQLDGSRATQVSRMKLVYASHSAAGSHHDRSAKENQDTWVINENLGGRQNLFLGVFDGHGPEGRSVSQVAGTALPQLLVATEQFANKDYLQAMHVAFPQCNHLLSSLKQQVNCTSSGSTGIVAMFVDGNKLVVSNLGDSRCIMGKLAPADHVAAYEMSNDHTPHLPSEAARIVSSGGRVARMLHAGRPAGPLRVWLSHQDTPGLCMTRSFGDELAHSVGVIDTPEAIVYEVQPEDRYLVVMSDGLYEFMDSQEIMELVHACATQHNMCPKAIARYLVKEARRRWRIKESGMIDDCTAVVVFMQREERNQAVVPKPSAPGPRSCMAKLPSFMCFGM